MMGHKQILTLLALSVCISCTKIEGAITSTGDGVGNWTLISDRCMTGDRERMIGATLYTEKNPSLSVKIFKDIKVGYKKSRIKGNVKFSNCD
jgi:hypothetical protein